MKKFLKKKIDTCTNIENDSNTTPDTQYDPSLSTISYNPYIQNDLTLNATTCFMSRNIQYEPTTSATNYTLRNIHCNSETSSYTPTSSQIEDKTEEIPKVHPPLPIYPPPPDMPPPVLVKVKEEVEYYPTTIEDASSINVSQFPTQATTSGKPKIAICKDFIRGNCLRAQCRFAHERDLTQLKGIYTFCWNFQNSSCQRPHCKFVHARLFEEEEFYRTGVLPPHVLNRSKQQTSAPVPTTPAAAAAPMPTISMLPPLPPPPPEEPPNAMIPNQMVFSNPPPPLYTVMPPSRPSPVMMMQPSPPPPPPPPAMFTGMETFRIGMQHMLPSTSSSWQPMEERLSFPSVLNQLLDCSEPTPESCSSCADMEFKLQYNKYKVEKQLRSNKELEEKNALLDHKVNKLYGVVLTMLNPDSEPNNPGPSSRP